VGETKRKCDFYMKTRSRGDALSKGLCVIDAEELYESFRVTIDVKLHLPLFHDLFEAAQVREVEQVSLGSRRVGRRKARRTSS
jgi:hypothetical protein